MCKRQDRLSRTRKQITGNGRRRDLPTRCVRYQIARGRSRPEPILGSSLAHSLRLGVVPYAHTQCRGQETVHALTGCALSTLHALSLSPTNILVDLCRCGETRARPGRRTWPTTIIIRFLPFWSERVVKPSRSQSPSLNKKHSHKKRVNTDKPRLLILVDLGRSRQRITTSPLPFPTSTTITTPTTEIVYRYLHTLPSHIPPSTH